MLLSDVLKEKKVSKSKLAELMGVSRQTIQRMGEDVSDAVLAALREYTPVQGQRVKEPADYTDEEMIALFRRRGGYEAETKPPKDGTTSISWGKETDYEIAQSLGIKVWEFNEMIADWCKRHPYDPSKARR